MDAVERRVWLVSSLLDPYQTHHPSDTHGLHANILFLTSMLYLILRKKALIYDRGDICLFVKMLVDNRIFDSADLFFLDFFISSLNPLHVVFYFN